jgi:hypothetical protein
LSKIKNKNKKYHEPHKMPLSVLQASFKNPFHYDRNVLEIVSYGKIGSEDFVAGVISLVRRIPVKVIWRDIPSSGVYTPPNSMLGRKVDP